MNNFVAGAGLAFLHTDAHVQNAGGGHSVSVHNLIKMNPTDTPRTDAERIGELERELQSMSNRLENMTDSRDCMIEDRNLLSAKVKRLHTENVCLKEQIQEFYEHLAFWPFMLGSLVIASIGFFYTLGKTQTGTFGDPIMALLWWLLPLTVILLKLGTYLPR